MPERVRESARVKPLDFTKETFRVFLETLNRYFHFLP